MKLVQPTNPESESPKAWARRVWSSWTPQERAEFAGAFQILEERLMGAGYGTPARKRRHDDPHEWKPVKRPFYHYRPDSRTDHTGRTD